MKHIPDPPAQKAQAAGAPEAVSFTEQFQLPGLAEQYLEALRRRNIFPSVPSEAMQGLAAAPVRRPEAGLAAQAQAATTRWGARISGIAVAQQTVNAAAAAYSANGHGLATAASHVAGAVPAAAIAIVNATVADWARQGTDEKRDALVLAAHHLAGGGRPETPAQRQMARILVGAMRSQGEAAFLERPAEMLRATARAASRGLTAVSSGLATFASIGTGRERIVAASLAAAVVAGATEMLARRADEWHLTAVAHAARAEARQPRQEADEPFLDAADVAAMGL